MLVLGALPPAEQEVEVEPHYGIRMDRYIAEQAAAIREEEQLTGNSYVSEAIRQFGIELIRIDIDSELHDKLLQAQERQRMVNA